MPRAKKKPEIPTGQPYGQHKRLEDAVNATQGMAPQQMPAMAPAAQMQPDPMQVALQQALLGPSPVPGGIHAPTARPNEPVTAGIPLGPGPTTPAVMQSVPRMSTILERMARESGSRAIAAAAARARSRGE